MSSTNHLKRDARQNTKAINSNVFSLAVHHHVFFFLFVILNPSSNRLQCNSHTIVCPMDRRIHRLMIIYIHLIYIFRFTSNQCFFSSDSSIKIRIHLMFLQIKKSIISNCFCSITVCRLELLLRSFVHFTLTIRFFKSDSISPCTHHTITLAFDRLPAIRSFNTNHLYLLKHELIKIKIKAIVHYDQ